jgi:hypothetical protein
MSKAKGRAILEEAATLAARGRPPEPEALAALVAEVQALLDAEPPSLRPRDPEGLPGGLLDLPDLPVLILPDLHGRVDFLAAALAWEPPLGLAGSPSLALLLERGEALLLCLGDAFHTEGPGAAKRWTGALREFRGGWTRHLLMDEEMGAVLSCVELILRAKAAFPKVFHYLKGNHDNIADEEGRGDHSFYKFALEGAMTASWFALRFGAELAAAYRRLELSLPLAARGLRFVASHAEPAFPLRPQDIVGYRRRPEVVEALTWTPNDVAQPDSVPDSLAALLGSAAGDTGALWFAGHRPVPGLYALRQGGRFVQFHNPLKRVVVFLRPGEAPDPARCVLELP